MHATDDVSSPLPPTAVPPQTVTIRLTARRADDAWCLDHPYLSEATPRLATLLLGHRELTRDCGTPQPPAFVASRLLVGVDELWKVLEFAAVLGYVNRERRGDHLEILTRGAVGQWPAAVAERLGLNEFAQRFDPHSLTLPDISGRHEDYLVFPLRRLPAENWALDSRYGRGVWGNYLGPNCNRLFGHISTSLNHDDEPLNIRATAQALRVTPARLHAELDLLHRHGLIDLEHDHGSIATSGYVASPPRHLLDTNPALAVTHRCLARQGRCVQHSAGLER